MKKRRGVCEDGESSSDPCRSVRPLGTTALGVRLFPVQGSAAADLRSRVDMGPHLLLPSSVAIRQGPLVS
jgi:hypothetical protein